ncbi:MAG: NAD-dependent epimerase/dehydratase family protein [Anaerolineaceae bacterium]|nr:NAD-dependent epimerase/dehydratase family protein [Anaerolineaceae bacterium]
MERILVTGAGGFIGHHLVKKLKDEGKWVHGVDIIHPKFESSAADEYSLLDLRDLQNAQLPMKGIETVYALAADMGGMGFIAFNHSQILQNNLRINLNTIQSAIDHNVKNFFFSSSACIYPEFKQSEENVIALKESDAFPAQPQDAYGWEKLTMEEIVRHHKNDFDLNVRIARFHNVYGPNCEWKNGREKVPAAICRKVARAKIYNKPEIEIWGDGNQTRSFTFITDCLEGISLLMSSNYSEPINLGSDRLISINELVDLVASISGTKVTKKHIDGPQGVRGRNSDNTLIRKELGWAPSISLEEGLRETYQWVEAQVLEEYSQLES